MTQPSDSPDPSSEEILSPDSVLVSVRERGDTFFGLVMAVLALLLLSQIGEQTKWVKGAELAKQPSMWPGVALGGFAIFAILACVQSWRDLRTRKEFPFFPTDEVLTWLRPIEYAAYFMVYSFLVPQLGYLPSTLVFCVFLALRAGYSSWKPLGLSLVTGALIVVGFKTLLNVKIPGGALYEAFPPELRNFMILNF